MCKGLGLCLGLQEPETTGPRPRHSLLSQRLTGTAIPPAEQGVPRTFTISQTWKLRPRSGEGGRLQLPQAQQPPLSLNRAQSMWPGRTGPD